MNFFYKTSGPGLSNCTMRLESHLLHLKQGKVVMFSDRV